jgi:hypothetical protein
MKRMKKEIRDENGKVVLCITESKMTKMDNGLRVEWQFKKEYYLMNEENYKKVRLLLSENLITEDNVNFFIELNSSKITLEDFLDLMFYEVVVDNIKKYVDEDIEKAERNNIEYDLI